MAMSAEEVVRASLAAFNDNDEAASRSLVTDDAEIVDVPSGTVFCGPDGIVAFQRGWYAGFSDAKTVLTSIVVSGNQVATEFAGRGTHDGPFTTPMGEIPATGRQVDIRFCSVWDIRDGKVAASRTYYDTATFARQLGLTE